MVIVKPIVIVILILISTGHIPRVPHRRQRRQAREGDRRAQGRALQAAGRAR